ncbi:MAG: transcriptional regulator FtsR [Actinomycetota bacterium]
MPLSRSRDYLSIGEVLDSIRADFPDVSISKIRFLEAEGLISPERTSSGYRKFYDTDVERLRYILSLQRDHFLPLKVIRSRLADVDSNGGGYPSDAPAPRPSPRARGARARPQDDGGAPAPDLSSVSLTKAELKKAAGLTEAEIAGLEDFGLMDKRADSEPYDDSDLLIAKAAKKFFTYGVEPRHLRMYRQFADREAAFFEQIVSPVAKRNDPSGQKVASQSMRELAGLSRQLREGVLRSSLRELP